MNTTAKVILWLVVIIIIAIAIWYGVSRQPSESDTIKIGFPAPLTGDAAAWGLPVKRGAEVGLDKVNSEGGVNGKAIELIFEDTKCDGATAATVVNKLINADKVSTIIGTVCSSVTLAMAPVVEENKVLLLSAGSSAPAVRDAGDYVFTIYPLDNYEAGIAADFAYDELSKQRAAILYANNDFGKGAKDVIEEKFIENGGEIKIVENYLVGAKDFRTELSKIKDSGADILFVWGQPNEMIPILTQVGELDIQLQIITTSVTIETDNLKEAGTELAEGVIYTTFKTADNENVDYLNQEYTKRYNKDDGWFPTIGYDVVLLIAKAMNEVGTNPTALKDYLYTIKDFPGSSGTMSFDEYGTVEKDFELKTVKDGEFVLYESAITTETQ